MRNVDKRAIIKPGVPAGSVPLRGPSGRLYGYLDPKSLVIEFKHGKRVAEQVDLKPLIKGQN